ncbi:MAG: hypothetical protein QNJ66_03440 [Crocosphaera sp.]|nr:hypothetical protein [Crocosphaera sp.]
MKKSFADYVKQARRELEDNGYTNTTLDEIRSKNVVEVDFVLDDCRSITVTIDRSTDEVVEIGNYYRPPVGHLVRAVTDKDLVGTDLAEN